MNLPAVIFICCGPGLSGCADSCDKLPPVAPEVTYEAPGEYSLTGTEIHLTYDAQADSWTIRGHGVTRNANDYPTAVEAAERLAEKLRETGTTP
jgi:hypothetical protein